MASQSGFTVYPAIDLRAGRVVRLMEGDPARQTNYSSDPAATAKRWIDAGASWLHVVNLDGAFGQSSDANDDALGAILEQARRAGTKLQFGGGIRTLAAIESALNLGLSRVIVGTLAIERPDILKQALERWGAERIGVSLDARAGRVQVRGWQSGTPLLATDSACALSRAGLRWLVYTDVARDGLQTGVNLTETFEVAQMSRLNVIASGGVSSMEDIRRSRMAGLAGAIVGRALYEGAIDPADLFADQGRRSPAPASS